jgi:hypothetical protein
MSRLIDRVVEQGLLSNEEMADVPKIDVSDVANYFYYLNGREDWTAADFPNAAPPFVDTWFEARAPKNAMVDGKAISWGSTGTMPVGWGYRIIALQRDSKESGDLFLHVESSLDSGDWKGDITGAKWILVCRPILEARKGFSFEVPYVWLVPVKPDGSLFAQPNGDVFAAAASSGGEVPDAVMDGGPPFLHPILLALSFMNAPNIRTLEHTPPPELQNARRRRGKFPLHTYKTIVIDAIKRMIAECSRSSGTDLRTALHQCRGHFKNFDDKPLFGRVKGKFWWAPQVRGTRSQGVSKHDYKVEAPAA